MDQSKQKMTHKGSAIFSKLKERRLDPELFPSQSWHEMQQQTPGPDKYHNSASNDKSVKKAVAFTNEKRNLHTPSKVNVPGPGQYDP